MSCTSAEHLRPDVYIWYRGVVMGIVHFRRNDSLQPTHVATQSGREELCESWLAEEAKFGANTKGNLLCNLFITRLTRTQLRSVQPSSIVS